MTQVSHAVRSLTNRRIFKVFGISLISILALPGIYIILAFVLSLIGVKAEKNKGNDVSIFILSNGVHTDFVLPVKNDRIDWSKEIKFGNTKKKDSLMQYLAFGWGYKEFYLETPTWADLRFTTAFKAAFGLGKSAIHTTYYKYLRETKSCVKISLSNDQYSRLVNYIERSFEKDKNGHFINIITTANYGDNDAFYEAKGSFTIFHTCNTWTNNGLKASGQKACLWTPFDKGILYQYNKNNL